MDVPHINHVNEKTLSHAKWCRQTLIHTITDGACYNLNLALLN